MDPNQPGKWAQACGIYAELLAYLRRPHWMELQTSWDGIVWRKLFLLFLLDIALLIVAVLVMSGYEQVLDRLSVQLPDAIDGADDISHPWMMVITAAIFAPLIEEVLWRSWLRGTPRSLLIPVPVLLLYGVLIAWGDDTAEMVMTVVSILTLVLAALVLWRGGSRPLPLFERHFVWFFWLSCFGFALIHLTNYEGGHPWLLLPMLLPQFLAGINWAFARMRFGLRASILLHAAANGLLVAPLLFIA